MSERSVCEELGVDSSVASLRSEWSVVRTTAGSIAGLSAAASSGVRCSSDYASCQC